MEKEERIRQSWDLFMKKFVKTMSDLGYEKKEIEKVAKEKANFEEFKKILDEVLKEEEVILAYEDFIFNQLQWENLKYVKGVEWF